MREILDLGELTPGSGRRLLGWHGSTIGWLPRDDSSTFYWEDYGAVAGGTDCTSAIQAALDAAGVAGGGVVRPRNPGDFYIKTATSSGGSRWMLLIRYDHVHLKTIPGARLVVDVADHADFLRPIAVLGMLRGGRAVTDIFSYEYIDATSYNLTGAVLAGATSVTTATAGDAANFAAGDLVFIRTGQTLSGSANRQPDSEINRVTAVDGSTGVVTLAWPLSKPYAAENYVSGSTGVTAVGGAGSAAPYTIAKVADRTIENVSVSVELDAPDDQSGQLVSLWQVVDATASGCMLSGRSYLLGSQNARRVQIVGNVFDHTDGTDVGVYGVAPSTGCTDWLIADNFVFSTSAVFWHFHEGLANIRVFDNITYLGDVPTGYNVVSVRSRAYDMQVERNTFNIRSAAGSCTGFYADETTAGGTVAENTWRLSGGSNMRGIRIDAPGWVERRNRFLDQGSVSHYRTRATVETETLACWVTAANALMPLVNTLGGVPQYAHVVSVTVEVTEAFNSDGTDLLSVGYSGSTAAYAAAVDVSTTGIKTVTLGTGAGFSATARTALATYTAGGSAPTTGKALVTLTFRRMPRES